MLKKIIILQLVMMLVLVLVGCNSNSAPQPKIVVEIKIDYYRVVSSTSNGSTSTRIDKVEIFCSWPGTTSGEMRKVEEDHYFYQAANIEAPTLTYGLDKYRIMVADRFIGNNFCTEDVRVNGKKLGYTETELGCIFLVFWVNSTGQIITTPQGN